MKYMMPDPLVVCKDILIESMDRPSVRVCPGCNGEGSRMLWTPGSRMPDPQTEQVCERCEGEGVVPR